jgi:hypothetical protein
MIVDALVLVKLTAGMIEASMTRNFGGRLAPDLGQHLARGPHHLVDGLDQVRAGLGLSHSVLPGCGHGRSRTSSEMMRRGARSTRRRPAPPGGGEGAWRSG